MSESLDQTRAARREELLDAADHVIRAHGPDVSMQALAAGAGITKPVLYRHFGDKDELHDALAERYVAPLLAAIREELARPGTRHERTLATVETYLAFIDSHRQEYRFLMDRVVQEGRQAHTTVVVFIRRIADEVALALARDLRQAVPSPAVRAWSHGVVGMVQLAGDWWLREGSMSRTELVDHIMTLLWAGLGGIDDAAG